MGFDLVNCSRDDMNYIGNRLVEYNLSKVAKTQESNFVGINKKIVDENNNIAAGCIAEMYCWNVIYIDVLWVDEPYRRQGFGTKLLQEIEKIALEENCALIHLDTFDFQAKDFYVKQGYEVFGILENCPKGHCRYYLKKELKQGQIP